MAHGATLENVSSGVRARRRYHRADQRSGNDGAVGGQGAGIGAQGNQAGHHAAPGRQGFLASSSDTLRDGTKAAIIDQSKFDVEMRIRPDKDDIDRVARPRPGREESAHVWRRRNAAQPRAVVPIVSWPTCWGLPLVGETR